MKTGTIYMHEFPNGQRYIGQTTTSLDKRFQNGKGYESCPAIADAIAEFGWSQVKTYILYSDIPINELRRYETLCIDRWQTYVDGLNRDRGKDFVSDDTRRLLSEKGRGRTHTIETREKIGKVHRGKTLSAETREKIAVANRGKKLSAETREKIGNTQRGKVVSAETRKRLSVATKGEKNGMFGKSHTETTRAKMSISHLGCKNHMFGKSHTETTRAKISQTKRRKALEKRGQGTLF